MVPCRVNIGVGKAADTINIKDPEIDFIFGQKGLMHNLTLQGAKFNKWDKKSLHLSRIYATPIRQDAITHPV